ncbi:unnamed protein product [Soboliphyme baturini]|uniref:Receptor protein-tyrosine kinase n=1 Tax=Soboliphyme baturini TaxID=241478 RepID=A0A183IJR6_9BILA|nr:unnamed protein product [Soboliphyme baturini]
MERQESFARLYGIGPFLEGKFAYLLEDLEYEANYTVQMRAVSSKNVVRIESSSVGIRFETASCLNANWYNFDLCPPNKVRDLKAQVRNGTTVLNWNEPQYSSATNVIRYYHVVWKTLAHLGRCLEHMEGNITLHPNETRIEINDLSPGCFYIAEVTAVSKAGFGKLAVVHFQWPLSPYHMPVYYGVPFRPVYLLSIPIIFGLIICGVLVILKLTPPRKRPHSFEKENSTFITNWIPKNPLYRPRSLIAHSVSKIEILRNVRNNITQKSSTVCDLWESLNIANVLGEGAFGCVYKATCRYPGFPATVAVKTLKSDFVTAEAEKHLNKEIELMSHIPPHDHVVRYLGYCRRSHSIALIMEYCSEGNLKQFLLNTKDKHGIGPSVASTDSGYGRSNISSNDGMEVLQEASLVTASEELTYRLMCYARQVAMGMEHLASFNLVHHGRVVKVSDFGLCRAGKEYHQVAGGQLPVKWMAPESVFNMVFTTESDVWSFGILLWELVTIGEDPYPGANILDIVELLKSGYRMPCPNGCDPAMKPSDSTAGGIQEEHNYIRRSTM